MFLSRGRTQITRKHISGGHVVHEAQDTAHFVHLNVLRGRSLDDDDDFVSVGANSDANMSNEVELRITVGEDNVALYFKVNLCDITDTRLIRNLHVKPYEQVMVSVSAYNRASPSCVINGFVTKKAIV